MGLNQFVSRELLPHTQDPGHFTCGLGMRLGGDLAIVAHACYVSESGHALIEQIT